MAELDLSLSDALTDSVSQPGQENTVERDFVAQLEAETFDDQVKEMVRKTDYIPLLDNDDTRAGVDTGSALENGKQETHGVQKPGLFQPEVMNINVETGAAPLQAERLPSIAESQHPDPSAGSDAFKEHSPMQPEPQAPRTPLDLSAGVTGDFWPDKTGFLATDVSLTPSVSMVFDQEADQFAVSPDDLLDSWPTHESAAYAGGDEKDGDGSDRKQKKKKKRRQKDEGLFEHLESGRQSEMQSMEENTPPADDFYHRIGPRRERGVGGWEEQLGKSGGRGKRGKNRKKLPEEWAVMAEPFVSSPAVSCHTTEVMLGLESGAHSNLEASFSEMDTSQRPWNTEFDLEEGLNYDRLSQDAAAVSSLVLNSELKVTAAPFTMPSSTKTAALGSFPTDSHNVFMDTEKGSLGHSNEGFSQFFSPEYKTGRGDVVGSGIFDTTCLNESSVQDMPDGDTSAFSSASQTSFGMSPKGKVLASAPPLSPNASWLLNDSNMSSNNEEFGLSEISSSGQPLTLGLSFDTQSPAPLRSPKTTAQESQSQEHKDVKSNQKQSRKSHSSSSLNSPTSTEAKKFSPQVSPASTPSFPSITSLGAPGSGLNPAAKPFFPSFADMVEEPPAPCPVVPTMEVTSEKMMVVDGNEEKIDDNVKAVEPFDSQDEPELKSVMVKHTNETSAKVKKELELEKDKHDEAKKIKKEQQAVPSKEAEKPAEMVNEKRDVKKPKEKVESLQQKEEAPVKVDKTVKTGENEVVGGGVITVEKTENVENINNNVTHKLEDKAEGETTEKTEMKDYKKQDIDEVETTTEQQSTENKSEMLIKEPAVVEEDKNKRVGTEKMEKEDHAGEPHEKPVKEPAGRIKAEGNQDKCRDSAEKKDDKKVKVAKMDGQVKAQKSGKPAANVGSATQNKGYASGDKKTKPAVEVTKPASAGKTQPGTGAICSSTVASTKRLSPSSTADKNTTTPKSPPAAAAGPKRPSVSSTSRPPSSSTTTTTAGDVKTKTTLEKRPFIPKARTTTSNQTFTSTGPKNGVSATATSKTVTPIRTTAPTRTTGTAAAKKPLGLKTDNKLGEEKKPSTPKTFSVDSTRPKMTTTKRSSTSTAAARTQTTIGKPTTPSSATVAEKKPSVPHAPIPASSGTSTMITTKPTARPSTALAPDVRDTRSKIGSTDNMKRQSGGGKVQITSKKLDFSHVTSRLGSKDNMKHIPGGGKVQILNKKVDVSKITSKCGSKDNIKHKPGGVARKIESHKVTFREKAQPEVGSTDNVSHRPGGGNIKAEGAQEAPEGIDSSLADRLAPVWQAESPVAQENGLKDRASSGNEGFHEPQALDSHIPETN